jgi:plasmid stabilization system protein ParE
MVWSIHYFDIVHYDIKEAQDWYRQQKPGLEIEFSKEIKKAILRLKRNPLGYEVKYKNIRTAFTDIFPYSIHFYMDESAQQLVIVVIIHQSRQPQLSVKRTDI